MISCHEIGFSYAGRPVLRDVSIDVHRSETLGILGRSGCGKTTLLKLLAGILKPDRGSIEYQVPIQNSYAFAFQNPVFFPWLTVRNNVAKTCVLNGLSGDPRRFLGPLGLVDAEKKYPWQLSGGMQRRLSIAIALALKRPLLLLDEPGTGLDDWTKDVLLDVLDATLEEENTTCIVTTHALYDAVFLSDRIILLGDTPGRILHEYRVNLPRPRAPIRDSFREIMHEVEFLREAIRPYRVIS